ncbi:MAG: hypothetical protein OXG92_11405 [Chloroflexi bacterium]|nr:hypothetical protein [Chloroflexota bacterium]MCY3583867.1 hypothetical protein [Chloroflexota bacterium]MCY3717060.1 hypothetical protein [Chloroflexota bacterium]MDE2650764.1 hypothetical protein [Chloroflexota bacterium]MXX51281.1 hypothetical protein [Chloroflexota bacterium]
MQKLKSFHTKYHSEELGRAMARSEREYDREYHHKELHKAIRRLCDSKNITREDLSLVEDDLNAYINRLVQAAYEKESQKLKVREFVDTRIKIKRIGGSEPSDSLLPGEAKYRQFF